MKFCRASSKRLSHTAYMLQRLKLTVEVPYTVMQHLHSTNSGHLLQKQDDDRVKNAWCMEQRVQEQKEDTEKDCLASKLNKQDAMDVRLSGWV